MRFWLWDYMAGHSWKHVCLGVWLCIACACACALHIWYMHIHIVIREHKGDGGIQVKFTDIPSSLRIIPKLTPLTHPITCICEVLHQLFPTFRSGFKIRTYLLVWANNRRTLEKHKFVCAGIWAIPQDDKDVVFLSNRSVGYGKLLLFHRILTTQSNKMMKASFFYLTGL